MTESQLNKEYFNWMCQLVCSNQYERRGRSHKKLLNYLHTVDYQYEYSMDGNRAEDGIDLRYRFGYECSYNDAMIASYLDVRPCSVLEMLIALAFRCEEHIMSDPTIGDRTGQWFWTMIDSLGLDDMTDSRFDETHVQSVIFRFMNHQYEKNGDGGLFKVNGCARDMRQLEVWAQLNCYLNSIV